MRITEEELKKTRNGCNNHYLITGGSGFIGSHLAIHLMERGHRITLLVRPGKGLSAQERIKRLIDWFKSTGNTGDYRPHIVEGYLDRPGLGLAAEKFTQLANRVSEIIHCGADTSFTQKDHSVNLLGLHHLHQLAEKGKCHFFHQISTTYVAGKREGPCTEILEHPGEFHNNYEKSKFQAEQFAREAFGKLGIRVNIYRPSIVYGNSETGRTFRFNALYYPVKTTLFLKKIYAKDIRDNKGRRASQMGVSIDEEGTCFLPIRMVCRQEGGLNLVPIDYLCNAFTALMEECLTGDIFHIINPIPTALDQIIDYGKKMFRIEGLRPVTPQQYENQPANGLEILFENYIKLYQPYINDTRVFQDPKAQAILKKQGISCPPFDYKRFTRAMEYAVKADWGKKSSPY